MGLGEVKEVNEVIATLEVIDDTLAGETTSRTDVVNFDNFDNFDNFKPSGKTFVDNFDNFGNFDNFKKKKNNN